jgi:hypothetical protein
MKLEQKYFLITRETYERTKQVYKPSTNSHQPITTTLLISMERGLPKPMGLKLIPKLVLSVRSTLRLKQNKKNKKKFHQDW